jgi:nitroimidazol reductase NimA-like FMN-containing flavoprotein (pyridoxamine 5'-phosphate oxidase superfamily)
VRDGWRRARSGPIRLNGPVDTLSRERCEALLEEAHVAHMGVVTDEGPYVTPISYVFFGTQIAFRTAPGRRTEALRVDPRVCVEVSTYVEATGDWESVIAMGTARVLQDDQAREQLVVDALFDKYRNAYDNLLSLPAGLGPGTRFIVVIDVSEISGRCSGGYLQPRTRPGRL